MRVYGTGTGHDRSWGAGLHPDGSPGDSVVAEAAVRQAQPCGTGGVRRVDGNTRSCGCLRGLRVECNLPGGPRRTRRPAVRSEEHTSELQSLMRNSYAVFCLKTKTNNNTQDTTTSSHTNRNETV